MSDTRSVGRWLPGVVATVSGLTIAACIGAPRCEDTATCPRPPRDASGDTVAEALEGGLDVSAQAQTQRADGGASEAGDAEVDAALDASAENDAPETGGDAAEAGAGDGPGLSCSPNSKRCQLTTIQTCSASGLWENNPTGPCPFVCIDGACAGECTPAATRCSSTNASQVQTCNALGQWEDDPTGPCLHVCDKGACTGTCTPSKARCSPTRGNQVQLCDASGAWRDDPAGSCPFVCKDGVCGGECTPGDTRCPTSTQVQTCSQAGLYQAAQACPFACVNKACAGSCVPGKLDCSGNTPMRCNNAGEMVANGAACPLACAQGVCVSQKIVFVTSKTYTGNLGGLAGADAICQSHAKAAGLNGTFVAWLSDETTGAAARIAHFPGPYVLVTGAQIAANWAELIDDTLLPHPIDATETGGTPLFENVKLGSDSSVYGAWTNTTGAGNPYLTHGFSCANWTNDSAAVGGLITRPVGLGYFSAYSRDMCNQKTHLFCFEN